MNNIYIVEDDPLTKQFYKLLLSKAGFNIKLFENGNKLFETIEASRPDLIILDINLKDTYLNGEKVDGLFLAERLKKSEKFSNMPILIVTALSRSQELLVASSKKYFDDIVVKPVVRFNDLIAKIQELIKKNDK